MACVTFILQLHQPYVLARFDPLAPSPILDLAATRLACQRFAAQSISPVHELLREVAEELGESFRVTCLVSGVALEILARYQPDVIAALKRLADEGVMDFAVTPYYHGLSCLVDTEEFGQQIDDARGAVREHLGHDATTLANTAMLYNDQIGQLVSQRGITTVICNRASAGDAGSIDPVSAGVLRGAWGIDVVMCDSWMSQRVAKRFSADDAPEELLTAPRFAAMLADRSVVGGHRTLIWDYGTFGQSFPADTGIFAFLRHLPRQVLDHGFDGFQYCCDAPAASVSETAGNGRGGETRVEYRPSQYEGVSADGANAIEMLGDPLISHFHTRLYSLRDKVLGSGSSEFAQDWRRMQAWDYLRNIVTRESPSAPRWWIKGVNSGYEGYVMLMGHCDMMEERIDRRGGASGL